MTFVLSMVMVWRNKNDVSNHGVGGPPESVMVGQSLTNNPAGEILCQPIVRKVDGEL